MSAKVLDIRVRLAEHPGRIEVYQPATDTHVEYQYDYRAAAREVRLHYQNNVSTKGNLSILVPKNRVAGELTVDGTVRGFVAETIGRDEYVKISTDWSPHVLRLRLK